jgi:hypothetical protein
MMMKFKIILKNINNINRNSNNGYNKDLIVQLFQKINSIEIKFMINFKN